MIDVLLNLESWRLRNASGTNDFALKKSNRFLRQAEKGENIKFGDISAIL